MGGPAPDLWDGSVLGYFRWWRNRANRRYAFRSAWMQTRRIVTRRFVLTYAVLYVGFWATVWAFR